MAKTFLRIKTDTVVVVQPVLTLLDTDQIQNSINLKFGSTFQK